MAQVARLHAPRPGEIDDYLAYLVWEWEDIPNVVAEWETWEELDRLDFVVEWPIKEDRWFMLRTWAAEGKLTPEQCRRYDELSDLIARHRPALERLLAE